MKCKFCGCTDENACADGCYWFAEEICSTCAPELIAVLALDIVRRFESFKGGKLTPGSKLDNLAERHTALKRPVKLAQGQGLLSSNSSMQRFIEAVQF